MRIRSGYSFRTAVGHLPDVVVRQKSLGEDVAVLSDRESTHGFRRFRDLCKRNKLRPVYGVELGTVNSFGEKKPIVNYCTFLAKSDIKAINFLVRKATGNPGKEPSLLLREALAAEGVINIIGERATFDQLRAIQAAPDTYLALSPSTPKKLVRTAIEIGIPLIATSDNYFPNRGDLEFYRVTLGKRSNTQTYPTHILSQDEWVESVKYNVTEDEIKEALRNRSVVLHQCNAELVQAQMYKPEREKTLYEMCVDGAERLGIDLNNPEYSLRLERELMMIKEKEFEDYFYIISDIVNWAKERMIVGPARGSSCGSLVCYLIGITTVDPIPYGLIFERFIDINRKDLPDIDIDFSDKRRDLVFDYMESKYGRDRVARLGTVGFLKARSALKQTASVLKIPEWRVEKVLDSSESYDLEYAFNNTEAGRDMLKHFPNATIAIKIEDSPSHDSQHAAGILVTQEPVINYVAIDERTNAAMVDKKDAEILNLLKIDALGLTQLSVFERTLQLIGKPDVSGWLETLPLDDQKAFDILNAGKFSGIFQFAGGALQGLTRQVKVETLDDIVSITALARPGPMASGGSNTWARRRAGLEDVDSLHPMLFELTKETYGVIVYQEQVMTISREIGKMDWPEVSDLRKAISKSAGREVLESFWEKFKSGALENGIEESIAKHIWDQIVTFGSYGFNKSHAVAYGIVSYWCCYLKAHHPIEFCAATLDAETDPLRQIKLLRELHYEGIGYIPFDADHSTDRWEVAEKEGDKILIGPLTSLKGIGPSIVIEILGSRKSGVPLRPTLKKRLESVKTEIDSIFPIEGAFKRKYPTLEHAGITREPIKIIEAQCGVKGNVVIIGLLKRLIIKDENEDEVVKRRGYAVKGPTAALNMFLMDDSDEIFAKIGRFEYEKLAKEVIDRGGAGKAIYAMNGEIPAGFRMLSVKNVKFLGFLDEE
jgi:DNA polymerase III alpha subunit